MSMIITNVYGPMESGKTLNSEAIAQAYGCDRIVEDDVLNHFLRHTRKERYKEAIRKIIGEEREHILLLTIQPLSQEKLGSPVATVPISHAKQRCGERWIEPQKGKIQ